MSDEDEIVMREAADGDLPYVLSSWVRNYGDTIRRTHRQRAIIEFRRDYVNRIVGKSPRIVVLCSSRSPSTLHGYAVVLDGALAWAYVTKDLRGMGLGRRVITEALGGYPDQIRTLRAWPTESARFRFQPKAA